MVYYWQINTLLFIFLSLTMERMTMHIEKLEYHLLCSWELHIATFPFLHLYPVWWYLISKYFCSMLDQNWTCHLPTHFFSKQILQFFHLSFPNLFYIFFWQQRPKYLLPALQDFWFSTSQRVTFRKCFYSSIYFFKFSERILRIVYFFPN